MLTDGVDVSWRENGTERHGKIWLIERDPTKQDDNEFLVVNQFTVIEDKRSRRPDVVVSINGLPLGVIELKNPAEEKATIRHAFNQTPDIQGGHPEPVRVQRGGGDLRRLRR